MPFLHNLPQLPAIRTCCPRFASGTLDAPFMPPPWFSLCGHFVGNACRSLAQGQMMMAMPAPHPHQFAHTHPAAAHFLLPTDSPRTGASTACAGMPGLCRCVMQAAKKEQIMSSSFKRFPWKHGGVSHSMGIIPMSCFDWLNILVCCNAIDQVKPSHELCRQKVRYAGISSWYEAGWCFQQTFQNSQNRTTCLVKFHSVR